MKFKNIFYFGISLLIVGCSSSPSPTNYYLLNNQPSTLSARSFISKVENKTQVIVVSVKELPEYLEQPYLVMQMSDHQLHYANFHMWAEPLKEGFQKALLTDLTDKDSTAKFIVYDRDLNQDSLPKLIVNIDFFHASVNSEVMLSGQYWLSNANKNEYFEVKSFTFKLPLDKNGYPHSVEKMRSLVSKLSEQIIEGIE